MDPAKNRVHHLQCLISRGFNVSVKQLKHLKQRLSLVIGHLFFAFYLLPFAFLWWSFVLSHWFGVLGLREMQKKRSGINHLPFTIYNSLSFQRSGENVSSLRGCVFAILITRHLLLITYKKCPYFVRASATCEQSRNKIRRTSPSAKRSAILHSPFSIHHLPFTIHDLPLA